MADAVAEHFAKLGAALRDARLQADRSQAEVGGQAGVSGELVSLIENGLSLDIAGYLAVAAALDRRRAPRGRDAGGPAGGGGVVALRRRPGRGTVE